MDVDDRITILKRRGIPGVPVSSAGLDVDDRVLVRMIGGMKPVALPISDGTVSQRVILIPFGKDGYIPIGHGGIDIEGMWDLCLGTLAGDPYTIYCNDHPYNSPAIYWTRSGCTVPPADGRGVWSISGTESARAAFVSYIVWSGINTTDHELKFQWKGSMSTNHPTVPLYFYIIYWEGGNVYYKQIAAAILGSDVNQTSWKDETITYNSGGSTIINLGFVIYSYFSGLSTYTLTFNIDVRYVDDVTM